MNELNALLNHKELKLTQDEFALLQQKMQKPETLIINNYIFMAKVKSTEWTHSYKCINNITREYHFIKIFHLTKLVQDQVPIQAQRIRSKTHKQMLMQTQHIVKCYELLQNKSFIMVVLEYCNEGILEDKIMDKKTIPLPQAIQWLKSIIYGLAQLYAQNIYLQSINFKKIFLKDGKCKVGDFQNLQRRLTMTEERLVKRHIHQLSQMFARLVFGLKKVENDEIAFILGQLKTADMLFGVRLTNQVKEFFIITLNAVGEQMISWLTLIQLKMFHDNSKSLSNTKFLQLAELAPEERYKNRPQPIKTVSLTQLTQEQEKLLCWDKDQYIQFLKTQLIMNKMIHSIVDEQCYSLEDRDVLEILYLITVRCMYNIRDILMKKDKMKGSVFIKLFGGQVQAMEKQISQRFYKYSGELTKKQSEKLQVGKDWLSIAKNIATLNFKAKSRKDKFLTGIQSSDENVHDYSKFEQIQFTVECINEFLSKAKVVSIEKGHVYYYLLSYEKIMLIKFEDLKSLTFNQYVEELINKQSNKKCD